MTDDSTGLIYLRARYYHPTSGTFLTQDPVMGVVGGPASTFNPYLYVRSNPVNLTDPSGRIAPLVAAGLYVVTDTISHVDQTVVLLTIDGETLTTTAEHPFYTISGEWVDAGDLEIGDEVVSLDGNGTVESIAAVVDPQPMYNLTVDEAHTFFVGDGDWLVHNTDELCGGLLKPYGEGRGHHVYQDVAFKDPITGEYVRGYTRNSAIAIPQDVMKSKKWTHADFTSAQRGLYDELAQAADEKGVADMLTEHTRVAYQALLNDRNMDWGDALNMVSTAYDDLLKNQIYPVRIPWND